MKLYSVPHSPYASRVRAQIYAGDLPVEICEPPGGLGSDTFKAMTPTGKVPTLEVDGHCIAESMAIMELLAERFPQSELMPADALQRAWIRSVSRFVDIYLAPALFPLFLELKTQSGGREAIEANLAALKDQLKTLETFLCADYRSDSAVLDLGDCALAPSVFYAVKVPPIFGEDAILADTPAVQAWWDWAGEQAPVARVLGEMQAGLDAMMAALKH